MAVVENTPTATAETAVAQVAAEKVAEKSAQEAKPAEESKPAEEAKPVAEEKPAEEAKPVEEAKPTEAAKEEVKPAEAAKEDAKPAEKKDTAEKKDAPSAGHKRPNPYSGENAADSKRRKIGLDVATDRGILYTVPNKFLTKKAGRDLRYALCRAYPMEKKEGEETSDKMSLKDELEAEKKSMEQTEQQFFIVQDQKLPAGKEEMRYWEASYSTYTIGVAYFPFCIDILVFHILLGRKMVGCLQRVQQDIDISAAIIFPQKTKKNRYK
jgi:hypothetical protein